MNRVLTAISVVLSLALVVGCAEDFLGDDHPASALHFPVSLVADPGGDYVYVVNSNFDLAYAGGTVVPLDLRTHKLVAGAAVQIGSFAGGIDVLPGKDGKASRLFVPTRDGENLTWIEVRHNETAAPGEAALTLHCADSVTPGRLHTCNGRYVFGGEAPNTGEDPFGVAVQPPTADRPGHVFTSAFDGTVSAFRLDENGDIINKEGKLVAFEQVGMASGSYDVAVHPHSDRIYITTKIGARVQSVFFEDTTPKIDVEAGEPEPEPVLRLVVQNNIGVGNLTSGSDFGRAITFSTDGTMAFAAYRTPPALLVLDTAIDETGQPANRVMGIVPLGAGPAGVAVAPSGPNGSDLVYVTLFSADRVAVVDPSKMAVIDLIDVGYGPFDIAIARSGGQLRAYLTLFEEMAVGVIELDRESYWYHREIARIR